MQLSTADMKPDATDLNAAAGVYFDRVNATGATKCSDVCSGKRSKMAASVASSFPTVNFLTVQALCPGACKTKPKPFEKFEAYYLPADNFPADFTVMFRTCA